MVASYQHSAEEEDEENKKAKEQEEEEGDEVQDEKKGEEQAEELSLWYEILLRLTVLTMWVGAKALRLISCNKHCLWYLNVLAGQMVSLPDVLKDLQSIPPWYA